ncbi:putative conidiation-specific expression protein [Cenococcum geophilum]
MSHQQNAAGCSKTMQNINETAKNISNSAQGHRAYLRNPNTSNASKQHPKEMLEKLGGEDAFYGKEEEPRNPGNVAGGLESTCISDEARQNAQDRLDKM